jgi:uncharacterized protein
VASGITYPVRQPQWQLTYSGVNLTARIEQMIVDITYTDKEQHLSDEIQVTLEDSHRKWQGPWLPQRGDTVTLQIGYAGDQLLNCGNFQVDELELEGPPDTFHLKCIAAGVTPSIRTKRSAGYEGQTLLQIANTVAQRHGLTVVGAPQNINVSFSRVTQKHETDLAFLRRLAQDHNYDFSIRGTQLVFYSRTTLEQQSSVLQIVRQQTKKFSFKTKTQELYQAATVSYQNPATKQLISQSAMDSTIPTGDTLNIVTRCETPQQAMLKAQSALHGANMLEVTGTLTLEGTTLLVAGVNITISGFKSFDGTYLITEARHKLDRSAGYEVEIEIRSISQT